MRWLLVSRQHCPAHGGIGTYVQRFLSAASEAGWHVELMTQQVQAEQLRCERVHEVTTIDMRPEFGQRMPELRRRHIVRPYRYGLWSKAVAENLLTIDGDFDAIEFVDCQAEGFAALGSPALRDRFRNAAFLVHAHTPMFLEEAINRADAAIFGRRIYHDWERRALAMADGVIVTSRVLGEALSDIAPSTVIPYPMDEARALSSAPREERIVLVGNVQPRKGVDVWARSLNEVLAARPRARAVLIGGDTPAAPEGRSMAAHVQSLIASCVVDRFDWAGSLPHERVRELIAGSALLVVPSFLESFSFAAAEALLVGTPVIVSDRTGIAEHVPSLPCMPAGDAAALARMQIEILSDGQRALHVADRCREEMLKACAPRRVLGMRQNMLSALRRAGRHHRAASSTDTLAEIASFITGVDAAETSAVDALASNVMS